MLRRAILLSLVLSCLCQGGRLRAAENAEVAPLMQSLMAGLRAAASYGRTGNVALAQIELDDARSAWSKLGRLGGQPVSPYAAKSLDDLLAIGRDLLSKADDALTAGDGVRAAADIAELRRSLHAIRRDAGIVELSDCVFDLSPDMDQLRAVATRFGAAKADAGDVVTAGTALRERLQRCNGLAPPDIASQAEFRRLIDGALASLAQVPKAIETRDGELLHRLLIELRSFDHLLAFRYG